LAIALLFAWSRATSIAALREDIAEPIERMAVGDYARLCAHLEHTAWLLRLLGGRMPRLRDSVETTSARMFQLLRPRLSTRDARSLYGRANYGIEQRDAPVLVTLLNLELELLSGEKRPAAWARALGMFRQVVALDAPHSFWRVERLPEEVARQIVDSAELYPLTLIARAEAQLEHRALRKRPPVGKVARSQGWFR